MSFLRHRQIYQSDVAFVPDWRRGRLRLRPRPHRLDEFAASYSLAGWSPPEPTSASPAGSIFVQPAETVNVHPSKVEDFSTGIMGNFQPVLTYDRTHRPGSIIHSSDALGSWDRYACCSYD